MAQHHGQATRIFLDLYQCRAGPPDLQRLEAVSWNFANLPWENLTKYLRKHEAGQTAERRRLSTEVLEQHAGLGTGGTCFSLSNALLRIVTDLGYHARPTMADMRHGGNVHCAVLVELEHRRVLLDPGYLVAEPVPLERERVSRVAVAGQQLEYRPLRSGEDYEMSTVNARGERQVRYRLRTRGVTGDEFTRHWLASFDSSGMRGLHLNRCDGDARLSAHDLNLRIDDGRDKHNLKLRDSYVDTVADRFRLDRGLVREAFETWTRTRARRT